MAFWGIEIKPGKPYVHQYDDERGRLRVSQATLGNGKSKQKVVVVCNVGDKKPIFLCSLFPKRMETCSLNFEFEEYEEVTFSVEGSHSVHLAGFFYGEKPDSDGDDDESDSYEGGVFEEESDSEDYTHFDTEDDEDDLTDNDMDMYSSSPKANSGVRIEEIVDDEKPPNENAIPDQSNKRKNLAPGNDDSSQQQIVVKSTGAVPVLESEDEDGFPISSPAKGDANGLTSKGKAEESIAKGGEAMKKNQIDVSGHTAKRKKAGSVRVDDPSSEPADVSDPTQEVDVKKSKKKNKKARIGEKSTQEAGSNSDSKVLSKDEHNREQTSEKVVEPADSIAVKPDSREKNSKKEKKKKKQQENTAAAKEELTNAERNGSASEDKPFQAREYPNGLIIEELKIGKPNGKRASPGKKVSVHYIGKLKKNGKIFDSNIGKAPFKFILGVGQVIGGWDIGVKGMRVGDKRRLTIPPSLGYGQAGAGNAIPPNAWLIFDIELVDVY